VFLGDFLTELAATVIQNKKKLAKRPELTDAEVIALANEIKEQIAAKADAKPKVGLYVFIERVKETETERERESDKESGANVRLCA
jgi:hypothetical protein